MITPFLGLTGPKAGNASSDLDAVGRWRTAEPHRKPDRGANLTGAAAGMASCGHGCAVRDQRLALEAQTWRAGAGGDIGAGLGYAMHLVAVDGHRDRTPGLRLPPRGEIEEERTDLSGSGSRTQRSKWPVKDGLVEMHLALVRRRGGLPIACSNIWEHRALFHRSFWRGTGSPLPPLIENDEITDDELEQARTEVAAYFATLTNARR
ncbi:MAG: hypothetical protein R3D81_16580 [Thalassovita sp.]